MNLIRSVAKLFGARFVSSIISFAGIAFFAQNIGANELGIFFLYQAVISVLMLPADFGLRGALEKRISSSDDQADVLTTALLLKGFPHVVISIFVMIFRVQLNDYVGADIAMFIILGLLIQDAYQVIIHLLRGELRVSKSANLVLIKQIVWVAGGVVAIEHLMIGARGIIFAWILGSGVALIYGLYLKNTNLGGISSKKARSLIDYAKFDVISSTGGTLFSWLDVIIIGFFMTQTAVGAYETAWRLSAVAIMFGRAIRNTIFPQISSWESDDEFQKISDVLTNVISAGLFLVIPSIVGVTILSRELLGVIFGEEFIIASVALSILIGQKLFQTLNQTIGRTLQAIDFPDLAAYAMAIGLSGNILLNLLLVRSFGIEGAACATLISYGTMALIRTYYLSNQIDLVIEWKEVGWFVIAAGVMGIVVWQVKSTVGVDGIYSLLGIVSLGVIVYFLLTFLSPTVRSKVIAKASDLFGNTTSFGD
jgi:O-antigen/teichoic acid export membrane protein